MGHKMSMNMEQLEANLKADPGPFKVYSKALGLNKEEATAVLLYLFNLEYPANVREEELLPFMKAIRDHPEFNLKQKNYALISASYMQGSFMTSGMHQVQMKFMQDKINWLEGQLQQLQGLQRRNQMGPGGPAGP